MRFKDKPVLVVMGVCGCGKSSVGRALAERLSLPFLEGDEFHPPGNVEKMSAGIPLQDSDRLPWLESLGTAIDQNAKDYGGVVASCSALKKTYRDILLAAVTSPLLFVFLDGGREVLEERMNARKGHFMPAGMLDSQLATLEPPDFPEPFVRVSVDGSVRDIVRAVLVGLSSS